MYYCNSKCTLPMPYKNDIILYNYYYGQNSKVKLLYTYRKEQYQIELEKGDTVKYIIGLYSFNFHISDSLLSEYYQNEEGILLASGSPQYRN